MTDRRFSHAELVEMFGGQIPVEAVNILWSAPNDEPLSKVRERITDLAVNWNARALASRPDGWMEIESAPRDGTWVVLWMIKPTPHGYASEGPHPVIAKWDGQNCWDVPFEDAWFVDADFTHWRRLPPAPQPKEPSA